jgi:hypothetical protein
VQNNNPDIDVVGQFQNVGHEEISFEENLINQDGNNPMIMNDASGVRRHTRLLDDQNDSTSRPKSMVGKRNFNYSQLENGNYEDSLLNSIRGGVSPGTNGLDQSLGLPA